jgi:hypothetical protein
MEFFQIIQNAFEILLNQLQPFVQIIMSKAYGSNFWLYMEHGSKAAGLISSEMKDFSSDLNQLQNMKKYKDVLYYLNAVVKNWEIFSGISLTNYPLCLCHSIKYFRNKWAHQSKFTTRELYRFFDECQALLEEFNLNASELDLLRKSILEYYYNEEKNKFLCDSISSDGVINSSNSNNNNETKNYYNDFSDINKSNNYCSYDDHEMLDSELMDKTNNIHEENYQKLFTKNKNNLYNITYYDSELESKNDLNNINNSDNH